MKVKVVTKEEPQRFKPITIKLTFESFDEIQKLHQSLEHESHSWILYDLLETILKN